MKRILAVVFLLIFALQLVSAADTEIKIKTTSFTKVYLTILNTGDEFNAITAYSKNSDYYGDVSFVHSGDQLIFDLMVVLSKNGETIYSEKFREGYRAGKPIFLEVAPEGYELLETPDAPSTGNETDSNSTEEAPIVEEEVSESEDKKGLSGFSIANITDSIPWKYVLYALGIIVVLGGVIFALKQVQIRPRQIKVTKLSDRRSSSDIEEADDGPKDKLDRLIQETESKLKELKTAQKEIGSSKNGQKIKELQERIRRDQEELKRISRR